jgi:hypothetical protein
LGDLRAVGRLGWLPFLILTVFGLVSQFTSVGRFVQASAVSGAAGSNLQAALVVTVFGFVALIVQTLCLNAFMVSWYRHVLKAGENVRSSVGYWPAFWRVFAYYVLLMVGLIVFVSIVTALISVGLIVMTLVNRIAPTPGGSYQLGARAGYFGGIVGAIIFSLCFTRASLVFPAAACGNSLRLRVAWRKMRGNTWRMIAAYFLVIIVYLAIALIPGLTYNSGAFTDLISGRPLRVVPQPIALAIAIRLLSQIILFLFLALSTSLAAIFYRELVLRPGPDVVEVFA